MKKTLLSIMGIAMAAAISAQDTYDFDTLSVGDYLGNTYVDWTTWSGTTGGNEDVRVDTNQAYSGNNSIYFSSTSATGGPQDVLLNFGGGVLQQGTFTFESMFYVEDDNAGYFNFQGETTPGNTYATSCYMDDDGGMLFSPEGPSVSPQAYPVEQWFSLKVVANLTFNVWELFIDNVSQGTWQNSVNEIASIDLYPVNPDNAGSNTNSSYWMDDVSWDFTPYTLLNLNAGVTAVNVGNGLATQERPVSVDIMNLGSTVVTSFDVTLDYNGTQLTENITGVSMNSFDTYTLAFSQDLVLAAGNNAVVATVSNVNGSVDDDASDDSKTIYLDPVVPAAGKLVIGEEATGTWCGWCPRGAVGLDEMERDYDGYFQGIAVHNGDPMTHSDYDAGIGGYISGYPSGVVDRENVVDPSDFKTPFLQRIAQAPVALIAPSASYSGNTLTVTLDVDFQQAISGDWRMACILIEDQVTGTDGGYNQANYYSSSSNNISLIGVDGVEWRDLANPVPASDMVYRHVARDIQPSFGGLANSFPASVAAGESYSFDFDFTIDAAWDMTKMKAIGILIDDATIIDNAGAMELWSLTSIEEQNKASLNPKLYPNPTNGQTLLQLDVVAMQEVNVRIVNLNGQTVLTRNYGEIQGTYLFPIDSKELSPGIYMIEVTVGNSIEVVKLVKN